MQAEAAETDEAVGLADVVPAPEEAKTTEASAEKEDYYDLRKTLPRFYRFFENLNKGDRPTTSILANALEVVEKMCDKDIMERLIDSFMRLDGTVSIDMENGRVVLRRRLISLQIRFGGMRLFRTYAPVVIPGADKGSRLAFGPTKPEITERFPSSVAGAELSRRFLEALLPLTEKELRTETVVNVHCPDEPRLVPEEIVGLPGLKSFIEIYDSVAEIQPTAPPGLLAALGLPAGRCFRGRGIICAWRHAAMSALGCTPQPLEQLLSGCLSGHEFLWLTFGVLQQQAYEGNWLQRPGRREDQMLLLLRALRPRRTIPKLPLGPWTEGLQPEALEAGDCGPEDVPVVLQLIPAAWGEEAEFMAREAKEILGTDATGVMGSIIVQSDSEGQVTGRLSALQLSVPFLQVSTSCPAGSDRLHSLSTLIRSGHEGCRLEELLQLPEAENKRFPFMTWKESWSLASEQAPRLLRRFLGVGGPLARMKLLDKHIPRELGLLESGKMTGNDIFAMLDLKGFEKALKEEDPVPRSLCQLLAGGAMSFEATPTEALLQSMADLRRQVLLLQATDAYIQRPWYSPGFFTHGSLSGGGVLVGGVGQMCLAGFGCGTCPSANPLFDSIYLSARLLLEDCPLPVAQEDLYSLLVESGADVATVADWLRLDEDMAHRVMFLQRDENASRRASGFTLSDLEMVGPWPASAVLVGRNEARTAQDEAQALSTAFLGLIPALLVPDSGSTAGLAQELLSGSESASSVRLRELAGRARPAMEAPRKWAWSLQITALEAIQDRLETEALGFAAEYDPTLRSEYESVAALSSAILIPHIVAAVHLATTKACPPWQCFWALRHAHVACSRLVKILQAFTELRTSQSIREALAVPAPAATGERRTSMGKEDLSWIFRRVEEKAAPTGELSIAGLRIGGIYFDLKHCLLVRLSYRRMAELEDEGKPPKLRASRPKPSRAIEAGRQRMLEKEGSNRLLAHKNSTLPSSRPASGASSRRGSAAAPEKDGKPGPIRLSSQQQEGLKRPQSGQQTHGRRTSAHGDVSQRNSVVSSSKDGLGLATGSNPGGERGFTAPIPGVVTEELAPGLSSTGMVVLRGQAFAMYGWPCPCFEGPDHKEREQLDPYDIELEPQETGFQEDGIVHHKPLFLRSKKDAMDSVGPSPAGKSLRRVVADQLQKFMDNTTHYYRGNVLELYHGSAFHLVPLGVTVSHTVASHKQATEFKLRVGIANIHGHAALTRVKDSLEFTRIQELLAVLDSEDWVKNNLRMSWSFESNSKDGIYITGDGHVKAYQELRKVAGWIEAGRAFVLPATLVYEAHRVEVYTQPFFTSPAQPTSQDPKSLIAVTTKLVLTDFENILRSAERREVATVDVTLRFRYSPELRMLPRGARIRVTKQDGLIAPVEQPTMKKDSGSKSARYERRGSNDSEEGSKSQGLKAQKEKPPESKQPRVVPNHCGTVIELSPQYPGMYEVQLDGSRHSVFFDPEPGNYELAGVFRYAESQALIVFHGGGWIEVSVRSIGFGNTHELKLASNSKKTIKMSLNELNHTPAKLKLATWNLHSNKYCEDLWTTCSHIADGLTCRRLDLLALPFAVIHQNQTMDEVSSESAESRESSQDSDDSDCEGIDAPTLEPHERAWRQLLQDMAPMSHKVRDAGALSRRAILVLGKPASGKSTLLRRLVLETLISAGGGCLPVLLEANEIVSTIYHPCGYCVEGDVLDAVLQKRYANSCTYTLLWQALHSRRVILFVDGADQNDSASWEVLTHYLHQLTCIGHPVVLLARPSRSRFRWHMRDHFAATSSYRMGLFSKPLQRLAAARLPAPAAAEFLTTFQPCELLCRHPSGLALLLSQAELRFSARLAPTKSKELSTDLLTQLVETAVPHLISFHLSACLPDGAATFVTQVLEVMAMKLFLDGGDLVLPETMQHVLATEHPDLIGSWAFVQALIESGQFVLVEPCVPPFHDERRGKLAMRFAPLPLRDYFLARCFTRYIGEKRVLGLPPAEDIIFDSDWNLFFDFLIELAATNNVCVMVDLSQKPVMTEAQYASFTGRLMNLQTPVVEVVMPPNQVNALPKLEQLLRASAKSVRSLGLQGNTLTEAGATELAKALGNGCELLSLQLQSCLLGPDGAHALMQAFLHAPKPAKRPSKNKRLKVGAEVEVAPPLPQEPPKTAAALKVGILDLAGNGIGPTGLHVFIPALEMKEKDGAVLQRLVLDENGLGVSGARLLAKGLAHNNVLRGLSVARNRIEDAGLEVIAQALATSGGRRLQRLVLSSNELSPLSGQYLAESLSGKVCMQLERLDLANNSLQADGVYWLAELLKTGLPSLKDLDLEYTDARSEGALYLSQAIQTGIPLRRLELSGCRLGAAGAGHLATALRAAEGCRIQRLGLRGNAIEDQGITALANSILEVAERCREFERGQRASLRNSVVSSSSGIVPSKGPSALTSPLSLISQSTPAFLIQLTELDVSQNRLGLFGADALGAALAGAAKARLTSLDVSRNCLGRSGIAALAAGLDEGCRLQHLSLGSTKMGDGGAEAIAQALQKGPKNLVWLQLQENRIGTRGLELLMEAIPKMPALQRLAASGNLAPDDWPSRILDNLVCADRDGVTKPSVVLLSASNRCWLGWSASNQVSSFGSLSPRFATVLQMEEATDGSKGVAVRRSSVLKKSAEAD